MSWSIVLGLLSFAIVMCLLLALATLIGEFLRFDEEDDE